MKALAQTRLFLIYWLILPALAVLLLSNYLRFSIKNPQIGPKNNLTVKAYEK